MAEAVTTALSESLTEPADENTKYTSDRPAWKEYITVSKVGIILGNLLSTVAGMMLATRASGISITPLLWLITIVGTSLVIASGAALNNYIDRDIDPLMKRTEDRTLAKGRLNPNHVLVFAISVGVIGLFTLAIGANVLSSLFAFVGLFVYVWIYTAWTKRTTTLNTVVGGIAGSMPPIIGYVAVSNNVDAAALILFMILFLWQPPHFLALAMRRVDDYRRAGIPMLPVIRGFMETKVQMLRYAAALVPASLLLYATHTVGLLYLVTAAVMGVAWILLLIRGFNAKDDIQWSKKMFKFSLYYLTIISIVITVNPF